MSQEPSRTVSPQVPAAGTWMSASASVPAYKSLNGEINKKQNQKLVSDAIH